MDESINYHSLELCGTHRERPSTLYAALWHPLFKGGTLDLFFDDAHYRMAPCHAAVLQQGICALPGNDVFVWRFIGNQWVSCITRDFPCTFPTGGKAKLRHSLDGKVILFEASNGIAGNLPARAVLYPCERPPTTHSLSIVGWARDNSPIFNGSYERHIVS